jgi:hypothetical protein
LMPDRKRQRRKKRGLVSDYRSQSKETTKGKEIVDEELVKKRQIKGAKTSDFSDGGFGCSKCVWQTPRKGTSGVQALRAHSKVHVRDRRAVVNTFLAQALVLAIAIVIALAPMLLQSLFPDVETAIRVHVPIDAELVISMTVVTLVLLTVSILLFGHQYIMTGKRQWWPRYIWSVRLLKIFIWVVTSSRWLASSQEIWWPWLMMALVPWAAWVLIGSVVASTRLAVNRGTYDPRNQRKLLKSKNEITDQRIVIFRRKIELNIRNGLIVLGKLSKRRRGSYDRLGVGKTRLSRRSQRRRLLKKVENRREIKRTGLRNKQRQDRRNRGVGESSNERY